jgi:hypothetical protein
VLQQLVLQSSERVLQQLVLQSSERVLQELMRRVLQSSLSCACNTSVPEVTSTTPSFECCEDGAGFECCEDGAD